MALPPLSVGRPLSRESPHVNLGWKLDTLMINLGNKESTEDFTEKDRLNKRSSLGF